MFCLSLAWLEMNPLYWAWSHPATVTKRRDNGMSPPRGGFYSLSEPIRSQNLTLWQCGASVHLFKNKHKFILLSCGVWLRWDVEYARVSRWVMPSCKPVWEPGAHVQALPLEFSIFLFFLRCLLWRVSQWTGSLFLLGWLVSEFLGSLSVGAAGVHGREWPLRRCWGFELELSCFHS